MTTATMEPMVLLGGEGGSSVGSETTEEEQKRSQEARMTKLFSNNSKPILMFLLATGC